MKAINAYRIFMGKSYEKWSLQILIMGQEDNVKVVGESDSWSHPVAVFDIRSVESLGSATRVLVITL
jgi:hypothetical protein